LGAKVFGASRVEAPKEVGREEGYPFPTGGVIWGGAVPLSPEIF